MRNDLFKTICVILDEMGYVIFDTNKDFNILDYISDSIQFISFIIKIEKHLDITLPDDFLDLDILNSATGFCIKLSEFLSSQ